MLLFWVLWPWLLRYMTSYFLNCFVFVPCNVVLKLKRVLPVRRLETKNKNKNKTNKNKTKTKTKTKTKQNIQNRKQENKNKTKQNKTNQNKTKPCSWTCTLVCYIFDYMYSFYFGLHIPLITKASAIKVSWPRGVLIYTITLSEVQYHWWQAAFWLKRGPD